MIRLLHGLGVLSLVLATAVLWLCVRQWLHANGASKPASVLSDRAPFLPQGEHRTPAAPPGNVPPLLMAAQALEAYLNPPPPPIQEIEVVQERPGPTVRPSVDTPKFALHGTIYCADQPWRSLALVCEPGANDGGRWVRQGAQLGHFVIHEIRPGSIVCAMGERQCEMAVEYEAEPEVAMAPGYHAVAKGPGDSANNARPVPPRLAKRPKANTRIAVGSPRTAALN